MMDLLEHIANLLGQGPLIFAALLKAAYNVTLHAYPDEPKMNLQSFTNARGLQHAGSCKTML